MYTNVPQPKSVRFYYTTAMGRYPSQTVTNVEAACKLSIKNGQKIHPLAFKVHTHGLGLVVTGWKVSPDMRWTLLGKRDPQLTQMYSPVADNTTTMENGDRLASRCMVENFKNHTVS